jgi:hypothetical protein
VAVGGTGDGVGVATTGLVGVGVGAVEPIFTIAATEGIPAPLIRKSM